MEKEEEFIKIYLWVLKHNLPVTQKTIHRNIHKIYCGSQSVNSLFVALSAYKEFYNGQ